MSAESASTTIKVVWILFADDADKQQGLVEEAATIGEALHALAERGDPQETGSSFLEAVQTHLQAAQQGDYIILASLSTGETLSSKSEQTESWLSTAQRAQSEAQRSARHVDGTRWIVGAFERPDLAVYVLENLDQLTLNIHADLARRLGILAAIVLLVTLVIDMTVFRAIVRPTERLAYEVRRMAGGQLDQPVAGDSRVRELDMLSRSLEELRARLAAAEAERTRQLEKARAIQHNLLPAEVQGGEIITAHCFSPAETVGGDYFDVVKLHDGDWLFVMADVVGHGVPAAMTASKLKTILLQAVDREVPKEELGQFVATWLRKVSLPTDFVTAAFVKTDLRNDCLIYINAGHVPPLLVHAGDVVESLDSTGPLMLGYSDMDGWEFQRRRFLPGDRLLMLTDGIIESPAVVDGDDRIGRPLDEGAGQFGRSRVIQHLQQTRSLPLRQVPDSLLGELKRCSGNAPQEDDITALFVERCDEGR
ncbi:MAG: SpoIIE family protein phosphatase [Pirellulaceae bacterium]